MAALGAASSASAAETLAAERVVVNFEGLVAIDRVSLSLARREVLGLIGPNGAGKTTLVNVLTGFQGASASTARTRPDGSPMRWLATAWPGPSRTAACSATPRYGRIWKRGPSASA
ncbi:MAG: ATP-binding cassette domain-containing protein [Alphaproteobacteria bacterium]|nr:ATP-binding cassette domain-containing protein [Alphaproteobacteria bacterium]